MKNAPKHLSLNISFLVVLLVACLTLSRRVASCQVAPPSGAAAQNQGQQLAYAADPANLPDAIGKVKSGDFAPVHLEMIATFHAVEAVPALKKQFNRAQDNLDRAQIASVLVRLGEKDGVYWDFLVGYATKALDANPPGPTDLGPEASAQADPPPEVVQWAKDNNVPIKDVGEELVFKMPSAVMMLALTGDERGIPVLRRALSSRDAMIQDTAAEGLALANDKDSVPLIIEACEKAPRGTAASIARALVYFDDPDAQKAVDKFMPENAARVYRESRAKGKRPFE